MSVRVTRDAERVFAGKVFAASGAVVSVGLLAAAVHLTSCESYERPCRVFEPTIVIDDARIGSNVELREDSGGNVTVSWIEASSPLTFPGGPGGALPSPAIADGGAPGMIAGGRAVVASPEGAIAVDRRFKTPSALASRTGSTDGVGLSFAGDGALFHWIETAIATEPNGDVKRSARLAIQHVGADGVEAPSVAPITCRDCRIGASFAAILGATGALVSEALDDGTARSRFLLFDPSGALVRQVELAFAPSAPVEDVDSGIPALVGGAGGGAAPGLPAATALEGRRDHFVARLGRRALVFSGDGALRE
jgi:hypothetical protein